MHPTGSSRMQCQLKALTVIAMMSVMNIASSHARAVPEPSGTREPRLLLNIAEKLLTDSRTAFASYMRQAMPPCATQSGCDELLGKDLPVTLPTNVNNCSRAALNVSNDLCLKSIWRNLKIFQMYLQLISEKSEGPLMLNHIKTDMKHLMRLINAQIGLSEKLDIQDLNVAEQHFEELVETWSKNVFTAQVLHLFIHQTEVVVRTFLIMNAVH